MRREEIESFDPFRPPWWRYDLAVKIARGEKRQRRRLDPVVKAVVDLLRAGERTTARRGTDEHDAELAAALRLHEEDGPQRWEVEARILARQADQEIADRCGLSNSMVALYTQVFFDLRQSLDATGYLMATVVGRWGGDTFRNEDVGRFWAWAAMGGGSVVLDSLVEAFRTARQPGELPTMSVYLKPGACTCSDMQMFVAVSVLPNHGPLAEAHIWWNLRLREASVTGDPYRAALLREQVQDDVIRCARAQLAGKPVKSRLLPRKSSSREHQEGDVRAITMDRTTIPAMFPENLAHFLDTEALVNGRRPGG